ncbi:MAG: alpha/beta fold hydrolase [Alphaproteobacteria bacterium]|nr:alpha/beta fold hydrolase [Alphaproteobacteria bacterium]
MSLLILHGLFGSGHNFRTLAKKLSVKYHVYCLDLRNHGNSPHDDDVSFGAMAADISEFMADHNIDRPAVMGHSLGGKVAMQLALSHPEKISKLIIGDIAPVAYPHHHDQIFAGLNEVSRRAPASRKEAERILTDYIEIPEVRLFLLTNLVRGADHSLHWRINVDGLQKGYRHIAKKLCGSPYGGPALFIRGALSDYVKAEYYPEIYQLFPKAHIVTLEGAGHWLHAEKPDKFAEIVRGFLNGDH